MNKFDDIIKAKLNQLDYDYDQAEWDALESRLGKADGGSSKHARNQFRNNLIAGSIAASLLTALFLALPNSKEPRQNNTMNVANDLENETRDSNPTTEGDKATAQVTPQEVHEIELVEIRRSLKTDGNPTDDDLDQGGDIEDKPDQQEDDRIEDFNEEGGLTENQGINNQNAPQFEIKAKGIQCPGSDVEFMVEGLESGFEVRWLFDGILPKEGRRVTYKFSQPGNHEAVAIVRHPDQKISYERVMNIEIFENPSSEIDINLIASEKCFSREVVASASSGSGYAYEWSFNSSLTQGQTVRYQANEGVQNVGLLVVNDHGCIQKLSQSFVVSPSFEIWIPDAFSPNGDGVNDYWLPNGLNREGLKYRIEIFNINNKIVYKADENSIGMGWDGSVNGTNTKVRAGEVFKMQLVVEDECNNVKRYQEKITRVK